VQDFNPAYVTDGVRFDRVDRGDTSIHVRSTPNTGGKFNASVPVALCTGAHTTFPAGRTRAIRSDTENLDRSYKGETNARS